MKEDSRDSLVVVVSKDIEKSIRLFSKKFKNSGLMRELFDRRSYEKPSIRKRNKHDKAVRMREKL
jgi:small subunit ribosomal protein S21